MEYKYVPNSYDNELVGKLNFDTDTFLMYQVKYRNDLEELLRSFINFNSIEEYFDKFNIPQVSDMEYNFYHKFSNLGSKYLFLRNNYHIENLTSEELSYINSCISKNEKLSKEFLLSTLARVVFEKENYVIFGATNLENQDSSRGFVFEFAYDSLECEELEQLEQVEFIVNNFLRKDFISKVSEIFNVPVNLIVYDMVTDLFKRETKSVK